MRDAVRTHLLIEPGLGKHNRAETRQQVGPVLDLGCGTGFCSGCADRLSAGSRGLVFDLAPRMLNLAAAKGLDAGLHEADIVDFLHGDTRRGAGPCRRRAVLSWRAGTAVRRTYARLLPGALFICSAEELLGPYVGNGNWVLGRQGRFAHAADYIGRTAQAAGFAVRAIDPQVQRNDAGAPVPGFLIVLERPHAVG